MHSLDKGAKVGLDSDLDNFDESDVLVAAKPALIGGGSAAVIAAGVRSLAPAGSFWEKHAGGLGAIGGSMLAFAAKQGGAAVAAALLVGITVEAVEYLTAMKMTSWGA